MESKIFLYDRIIGSRLKFYRKKRGLTQAGLSNLIGISPQQLQKYEIGKNKISASRLKFVSEILDVPVQYLIHDPQESGKEKISENVDNSISKLTYYYSRIKSERIKKLLIYNSSIYVESGY